MSLFQYQARAEPVPLDDYGEQITVDKWWQPLSVPVRLESVTPAQWGGVAVEPFIVELTLFVLQQLDWLVIKPLPVVPPIVAIDTTIWVPDLIPSSYDPSVQDWGQVTSLPMRLELVSPAQWGGVELEPLVVDPAIVDVALIILQRRSVRPTITAWVDVSSTPVGNATIQTDAGDAQAAANASYLFRVLHQNATGRRTAYPSLPLRQDFDGASVRIAALPNRPAFVYAKPIVAAKVKIRFAYNPIGESGVPSEFRIYEGATLATVDYGTPLVDSVTGLNHTPFDPGAAGYEFTTGVLSEAAHVFVVRGRTAAGDEEANTSITAPVTADATPVSAASAISVAPAETS